jgi:hypothetical protein
MAYLSDEQLDTIMIASLPSYKRCLIQMAHDYVAGYIEKNGGSWGEVYKVAAQAFAREGRRAANDEEPFPQAIFRQHFHGDKEMATALYWL